MATPTRRPRLAPIPRRIPPLTWRQPVLLWTPIALALALGWPVLALMNEPGIARTIVITGATAFAIGLLSLGVTWALGRPPRTHHEVLTHLILAGAIAALGAPFVLERVLQTLHGDNDIPSTTALALAPLALLIGLPVALFSGLLFSLVALVKRSPERDADLGPHFARERG